MVSQCLVLDRKVVIKSINSFSSTQHFVHIVKSINELTGSELLNRKTTITITTKKQPTTQQTKIEQQTGSDQISSLAQTAFICSNEKPLELIVVL